MATHSRKLSSVPLLLLTACPVYRDPQGDDDVFGTDSQVTIDDGELTDEGDTGPGCSSDADCPVSDPICDKITGSCFPECVPGESGFCFTGDEDKRGIGICTDGHWACNPMGVWSECKDQGAPLPEDCYNGLDDDCDGFTDKVDKDGDGFFVCGEENGELIDCCDEEIIECINAELVNPGAYEVVGNDVDDDCDGEIDEEEPTCEIGLISSADDPLDYARAIELCATTTPEAVNWGVLSGKFGVAHSPSDANPPADEPVATQRSIRQEFGVVVPPPSPMGSQSMAVLSSGTAAAPGQNSPNFNGFEPGTEYQSSVDLPVDIPTCSGGVVGNGTANDSIQLSLDIRVPTNARSFTVRFFFYSAEFPEWVCGQYNDAFVAMITSESEDNIPGGNIAVFDAMDGKPPWPISVNMAALTAASDVPLFTICRNGTMGCQAGMPMPFNGCISEAELMGTGFDVVDVTESCNGAGYPVGGGTGWLEFSGNVVPGEVMSIDFAVWDAGGHKFDSLVLLDNWQWALDAAEPGVHIP